MDEYIKEQGQEIIRQIAEYASDEHPPEKEGIIIPYQLGYTDANLLFTYVFALEDRVKYLEKREEDIIKMNKLSHVYAGEMEGKYITAQTILDNTRKQLQEQISLLLTDVDNSYSVPTRNIVNSYLWPLQLLIDGQELPRKCILEDDGTIRYINKHPDVKEEETDANVGEKNDD